VPIWRMAFRDYSEGPSFWHQCLELSVASMTYEPVADIDLSVHATDSSTPGWDLLEASQKGCLRHFVHDIAPGDIIYAKEGPRIVGRGMVSRPYQFDVVQPFLPPKGVTPYRHHVRVEWCLGFQPLEIQIGATQMPTLLELAPADVVTIEDARRSRAFTR
jgi:hypothetical protein